MCIDCNTLACAPLFGKERRAELVECKVRGSLDIPTRCIMYNRMRHWTQEDAFLVCNSFGVLDVLILCFMDLQYQIKIPF